MSLNDFIKQYPECTELLKAVRNEIQQALRPPEEIIYDDIDLCNYLKVSKRTTAYWREKKMITFSQPGGKVFYRKSDVLAFLKSYETQAVRKGLKIQYK